MLFELGLRKDVSRDLSQFMWVENENNWLFIIEEGKRMKTLSLDHQPAKEVQFATLAETRYCTNLSWNKDGTRMALVIDERQVYLWNIASNNFNQLKPKAKISDSDSAGKRANLGYVSLLSWSKKSNKLAICYSTGQVVICDLESSDSAGKIIDNSAGVLAQILQIEVCDHIDMFAGITVIFEILVMTFDGEAKFYLQANSRITHLKFSHLCRDTGKQVQQPNLHSVRHSWIRPQMSSQPNLFSVWLSYQTSEDKILFVRIFDEESGFSEPSSKPNHVFEGSNIEGALLVDHYWLNDCQLICCFSSGCIKLLELKKNLINKDTLQFTSSCRVILNIREESDPENPESEGPQFKAFQLRERPTKDKSKPRSSSLAALTAYELFYYELFTSDDTNPVHSFERVDDINLTGTLMNTPTKLEQARWSFDCSMLAVQLTNGHILIYRTNLQNYVVTSFGSKSAYLSGPAEITIIDYKVDLLAGSQRNLTGASDFHDDPDKPLNSDKTNGSSTGKASSDAKESNNALVINVDLKPSLIAVGPNHLAVALNNRVRYYLVSSIETGNLQAEGSYLREQEYSSIVVNLQLCSRYVAVRFDDGRLKLHSIETQAKRDQSMEQVDDKSLDEVCSNERFFPDPGERISGFTLTEQLFIYCTDAMNLIVFCLSTWSHRITCDHSKWFCGSIFRLVANGSGNKFICLFEVKPKSDHTSPIQARDNVCLYDLYSNSMIGLSRASNFYSDIVESQLILATEPTNRQIEMKRESMPIAPRLSQIIDALWDIENRSIILIEHDKIHVVSVLNISLENNKPLIEYVTNASKASSHRAIYLSHGIVCFQTRLGRVINCVLKSHDDELKLTNLEKQIRHIKSSIEGKDDNSYDKARLEVMRLKLEFLASIISIYSLTRCKDICEHLMSDEQFKLDKRQARWSRDLQVDNLIWRQLAARAIYTMDLEFALMIYQKHKLLSYARTLSDYIETMKSNRLDSKASLQGFISDLFGCSVRMAN